MIKKIQKNIKNPVVYGYIAGVLAIVFYSIINILSQSTKAMYVGDKIIFAVAFVLTKEIVTIIMYFVFGKNPIQRYNDVIDTIKKFKKESLWASFGGVMGGFVGFVLITAGTFYLSSGLASPFYSTEIIIVFVVVRILFKRKPGKLQIMAVAIIAIAMITLPVLDVTLHSGGDNKNILIGVPLIMAGVSGWAIETIIFDKISERKGIKLSSLVAIKQVSSLVVGLVLTPFIGMTVTHASDGFEAIGDIVVNWKMLLMTISAGVALYAGRTFFFLSNKYVGGTASNAIYNLLFLVQLPLAYIAQEIEPSVDFIGNIQHEYFWVISSFVVFAVLLLMYSQYKDGKKI